MTCHEQDKPPYPRARGMRWQSLLLVALVLAGGIASARAQVDNGVNLAVWKMLYGVTDAQGNDPAWLTLDDDGDGLSNGAELAAGTNPFNVASTFAVTSMSADVGGWTFTFPTAVGKQYALQFTTDPTSPTGWAPLDPAATATGTGAPQTITIPAPDPAVSGPGVFYRVTVQDADSDGDHVSDWAEKITGYDPPATHTHNAALDDDTTLAADLAQENVVTVTATNPTATQPGDAITAATDTATLTITRGGTLHFSAITVPLSWTGTAAAGIDYAALPASVTFPARVGSMTLTVVPLANAARQTPATVTLSALPGGGYALGAARSASAVISPAGNPTGTGLTGSYYNYDYKTLGVQAKTISTYNPALLFAGTPYTRLDPVIDFNWNIGSPVPGVINATYFTARWQGQIQPQFSETYTFDVTADDGFKLWINGQPVIDKYVNGQSVIDSWTYVYGDHYGSITLQAGVLYDIRLEYNQVAGNDQIHLYWFSDSQPKQIVPTARLYPMTAVPAPPVITSAPTAVGFVNQPFTFTVTASFSGGAAATFALGNGSGPLPPGLTLDPVSGVISGTPTTAGNYQIALTATNNFGVGAGVLALQILTPGSGVTREVWQGLGGSGITDLPLTTLPDATYPDTLLTTLEDTGAYPANTGERLRGYFVAPATGNYYLWLAASNVAELWISNNAEPVNLTRRAWIAAPGTDPENWSDPGQPHGRSPWLALVAGQSYYYEVLHNTGGAGVASHVAVGFLQDSTGTAANPAAGGVTGSGVVPGYVLKQYDYPANTVAAGTLYVSNLSPQGTAVTAATGSADLRLLPGNTQAILHFNYSGLSSPRTAYHVHIAPDNTGSGPIVFDLDDVDKFHPELKTADGGYLWNITDAGAYTAAQIATGIQRGTTYVNVHTVNYPNGEIRGFLTRVNGSQAAPAVVPDPGFTDDHATDAGAARFLNQAAFGAAPGDLAAVQAGGYTAWLDAQMGVNGQPAIPVTRLEPDVLAQAALIANGPLSSSTLQNAWWRAAVTAPDQLRQRMAFALSEIVVVSDSSSGLSVHAEGLSSYYDTLANNAFGNFRDLLRAVTLHPTMGYWLNMLQNSKANAATGHHPNENYAREILQLFSIGLHRLWPDGSLVLDSRGNLVPTYDESVITGGFARVFTGWSYNQPLQAGGLLPTNLYPPSDFDDPMVLVKNYHELGAKTLLDNVVLPPAVGYNPPLAALTGSQGDVASAANDAYGLQDLELAIDNIFNHPNIGPYICRQLIQRLVASNPSPAYLQRVVTKFNDDGTAAHVRGNMAAVVRAILLDGEARDAVAAAASPTAGKQREPLLRITGPARTFPFVANSGTYTQTDGLAMTINTTNPHRYNAGDRVGLDFSVNGLGAPAGTVTTNPNSGSYTILADPAPTANSFAVNVTDYTAVACTQAASSKTLTVGTGGPPVGEPVYLKFLSGGFPEGIYNVSTLASDGSSFTVTLPGDPAAGAVTGSVIVPKANDYYYITNPPGSTASTITVVASVNLNLKVNDPVWLQSGPTTQLKDAQFTVASIIDDRHFTLTNATVYKNESSTYTSIYPLVGPTFARSGNVNLPASKFDMGNTNSVIAQTPLDSTTVFNFFSPDYQYPGALAANNVTTPEFQLTTDSNIITLTNTIASTILSSGNTNGLSNFKNGAINLDFGAYLVPPYIQSVNTVTTPTYTTTGGVRVLTKLTAVTTTVFNASALVNKLGDVLAGGMLTQATKDNIVALLTNTTAFPTTVTAGNISTTTVTVSTSGNAAVPPATPVAPTTARDLVRAAVQLILVSPEYAVQR